MAFYKQDIVDINLNTGNIFRSFLNHSIGFKNDDADRFGIRVFRDGEPVDLTGASCQAVFMNPNGTNIALTSYGTVSGNVAYVTLPQACYDYEGQFCLSIQLVGDGVTGTMRILDGMVVNTGASGTVAPTASVPTYQEILSTYDAMVAATAAANGAIAATYSSSSTYAVGDYCIHDGGLYRCTTAITTGEAWTAAHWTAAKIGPDVSELKNAIGTVPSGKTVQGQIDENTEDISGLENAIGTVPSGKTVQGQIDENTQDISGLESEINSLKNAIGTVPSGKTVQGQIDGLGSETDSLKSALSSNAYGDSAFEDENVHYLQRGLFVNGVVDPNNGIPNRTWMYRISALKPISFPYYAIINILNGFKVYYYTWNGSEWEGSGWETGTIYIQPNTKFYIQIARTTEDESETANIDEFLSKVLVKGSYFDVTGEDYNKIKKSISYQYLNYEPGGWVKNDDDVLVKATRNDCSIRSREKVDAPSSIKVNVKQANVRVIFSYENASGIYIDRDEDNTVGFHQHNMETKPAVVKLCIFVIFTSLNIIPANIDDYFTIQFMNDSAIKNGKQVLLYRFGGAGNDWCFVRLPEHYDQFRKKPYPFVICNHGNGWWMDGTIETANWTKRTMYVPLTDPDYIADPTEYNGTSDESLWYSNPTIEALLTAGYIVCGCENYSDELYGNNNCRNACVDFFYHMVNTYNVEDRCYMIGASNGAMTSLNAAYLLQGKVKAMILQYPLTCLVNQYEHYPNHQASIREAYGITDPDISIADLTKAVATHDPLTVDVVDGKKVGVFPPVKLYYSPDDAVVPYQYNSIALANMLDASNKVVSTVQCSGEHGDHTHFAPADYVAWFNAN